MNEESPLAKAIARIEASRAGLAVEPEPPLPFPGCDVDRHMQQMIAQEDARFLDAVNQPLQPPAEQSNKVTELLAAVDKVKQNSFRDESRRKANKRCDKCHKRRAIKTDSQSRELCRKCAMGLPDSYKRPFNVGRNELCPCGSGEKFKHCRKTGHKREEKAEAVPEEEVTCGS